MAGGKRSSDTPSFPGDDMASAQKPRRRQPPTIDLRATNIEAAAPTESPVNEPPTQNPPRHEPPKQDPPREEPPRPKPQPAESPRPRSAALWPIFAAGLAGGVVASVLWYFASPASVAPVPPDMSAANARVAALEKQIQELQSRPAPAAPPAQSDPALSQRLDVAENAMKSLGVALAAIGKRIDDSATNAETAAKASGDVNTLSNRIAALEQNTRSVETSIAKAAHEPDTAARLAVAVSAVRDAAVSGAPFADELALARSLGADAATLAVLEPFATSGVPRETQLSRELTALLPLLTKAAGAGTTQPEGFLDKLQANAGKLVRVRPINEAAGDDASAIVARVGAKAAQNDVDGALAELAKLPANVRAPADAWSKRVEARKAALAASRTFAADSVRALGVATK